jgi:hypothetical protein
LRLSHFDSKPRTMRLLRIVGLILVLGAASYFLFVFVIVFSPTLDNYLSRTAFDSEKWKNWRETEAEMSLRWDMVSDLQDKHQLDGMTENEIIELLGEPRRKSSIEWTYHLGMARQGIDTGTLRLTFENGRVKNHHVRTG